jgi:hypothetical protein
MKRWKESDCLESPLGLDQNAILEYYECIYVGRYMTWAYISMPSMLRLGLEMGHTEVTLCLRGVCILSERVGSVIGTCK